MGKHRGRHRMEKCKLEDWPADVARHTFDTMHYNAHQNAAATMAQPGHSGTPDVCDVLQGRAGPLSCGPGFFENQACRERSKVVL